MSNRRRRRSRSRRRIRASNPRRRYRRFRNPRSGGGSFGPVIPRYILPAVLGGVGAVGFDVLWGYVEPKLPSSLQGGWAATAAEVGVILGSAYVLDKAMPRHRQGIGVAALGALTIVSYNILKGLAPQILPAGTPGLSGYMPAQRFPLNGLAGGKLRPAVRFAGYMPRTFSGLGDLYDPASLIGSQGRAFPAGAGATGVAVGANGCCSSGDDNAWNGGF